MGLLPLRGDPARWAGHPAVPPRGRHPAGPDLSAGLRAAAAVNPDRVRLRVRAAEGWVTTGATGWERTAEGADVAFRASVDESFRLEVTPN